LSVKLTPPAALRRHRDGCGPAATGCRRSAGRGREAGHPHRLARRPGEMLRSGPRMLAQDHARDAGMRRLAQKCVGVSHPARGTSFHDRIDTWNRRSEDDTRRFVAAPTPVRQPHRNRLLARHRNAEGTQGPQKPGSAKVPGQVRRHRQRRRIGRTPLPPARCGKRGLRSQRNPRAAEPGRIRDRQQTSARGRGRTHCAIAYSRVSPGRIGGSSSCARPR
jgi:hypothetical protein